MMKRLFRVLDRVTPGATRSLGWEVIGSALTFPASILLNRSLGAEDRGLLALVILIPTTIFTLGTCQWDVLLKGLITSKQISGREAWRRTVYYAGWLSLVFIPVGVAASLLFNKLPHQAQVLSLLYLVNFPIYFFGGCLAAIYVSVGSLDKLYSMKTTLQGSYLVLLIGLLVTQQVSIQSMVGVYIATHVLSLASGLLHRNKVLLGDTLTSRPPWKPLFIAFFPYALMAVSSRIDTWAFSLFSSLSALGQYIGITALMLPVGLVSNAMTNGSTAHLDWTNTDQVQRYLIRAAVVLMLLLALLVLGGKLIGASLLNTLLGKSFEEGYWMLPWVAAIVISQAAASQFHTSLQLSGAMDTYLMVQSVEPVVRLLFVLFMGWFLSELGILVGMTLVSLLKTASCIYLHRKVKTNVA
jgi:O-antigen/teichoic acid export membrane protein